MTLSRAPAAETTVQPIDLLTFTKAFVAGLVTRGAQSIHPQEPADRRGFQSVVELLDAEVDQLVTETDQRSLARGLIRIANELRPSNSGSFEGFEAALRALQLTFASCPNPWYDEIEFSVPEPYARSTIAQLPEFHRKLVEAAAAKFLEARDT